MARIAGRRPQAVVETPITPVKIRKIILLALFAWFAALWLKTVTRAALSGRATLAKEWDVLETGAGLVLWWVAFDAASRLLARASQQPLVVPRFSGLAPSIDAVITANPTAAIVLRRVRKASFNTARQWRASEEQHAGRIMDQYRTGTPAQGDQSRTFPRFDPKLLERSIDYRVRRFKRDQASRIATATEEEWLKIPAVGRAFPYAEYHSREDKRVRPTHATMAGFVARRTNPVWNWVLPSTGYNCRCYRILRTIRESIARGWMSKDGKPLFAISWPNEAARANYQRGIPYHGNGDTSAVPKELRNRVFPDPGPFMISRAIASAL